MGGGTGGWCVGIRRRHPHLQCQVFDLPEVREIAERLLAEDGEGEKITFVPGSFFTDELPAGADVALLANVLHNWNPQDGHHILANTLQALEPGGKLLVKEYFFEDDWTGPMEAVFEAFMMLGAGEKSGWQPSFQEMEEMLGEAGFVDVERRHQLIVASKPGA